MAKDSDSTSECECFPNENIASFVLFAGIPCEWTFETKFASGGVIPRTQLLGALRFGGFEGVLDMSAGAAPEANPPAEAASDKDEQPSAKAKASAKPKPKPHASVEKKGSDKVCPLCSLLSSRGDDRAIFVGCE